ncbi:MAG: hypothetical protein ACLSHV_10410 [Hominisplanchenecus sp.]
MCESKASGREKKKDMGKQCDNEEGQILFRVFFAVEQEGNFLIWMFFKKRNKRIDTHHTANIINTNKKSKN